MGRRKNNINDMTISEQIEAIKDNICEDYCKKYEEAFSNIKDADEAFEWLMHNYCEKCPFGRL